MVAVGQEYDSEDEDASDEDKVRGGGARVRKQKQQQRPQVDIQRSTCQPSRSLKPPDDAPSRRLSLSSSIRDKLDKIFDPVSEHSYSASSRSPNFPVVCFSLTQEWIVLIAAGSATCGMSGIRLVELKKNKFDTEATPGDRFTLTCTSGR